MLGWISHFYLWFLQNVRVFERSFSSNYLNCSHPQANGSAEAAVWLNTLVAKFYRYEYPEGSRSSFADYNMMILYFCVSNSPKVVHMFESRFDCLGVEVTFLHFALPPATWQSNLPSRPWWMRLWNLPSRRQLWNRSRASRFGILFGILFPNPSCFS